MTNIFNIENKHYKLVLWNSDIEPRGSCYNCAFSGQCETLKLPECYIDDNSAYFVEVSVENNAQRIIDMIDTRINTLQHYINDINEDYLIPEQQKIAINGSHKRVIEELLEIRKQI